MAKSELLPCPFCGGVARMVVLTSYPPKYQVGHACEVVCAKPAETPEQAIAAWNTRAETRAERDLRDEVNWLNSELHGAEMGRTCRNVDEVGEFKCSECGHFSMQKMVYRDGTPCDPKFCPNCGAKVVEE